MNRDYHLHVKLYPRIWRWLLSWLQRKCRHRVMKADILEGCAAPYGVRWCETCGAVIVTVEGTPTPPRLPEPSYELSPLFASALT